MTRVGAAAPQEIIIIDALISQIYVRNKTLHVSDSSSVHHQEFFTVHTAVVYVLTDFNFVLPCITVLVK